MKKLNLKVANLNATEILSREELKHVLGGEGSGGSDEIFCTRSNGWDDDFCSGSPAVMGSWAAVWTSFGWSVRCSNGFDNGIHHYIV
jgi:hypothetical protein